MNRLVVFAKAPLPGQAKTRLAADIGPARAARIAAALLADTLLLCDSLAEAAQSERVLAHAGERGWFERHAPPGWHLLAQRGGNLGQRLDNALADLGPGPEDRTLFLGMDAPHISPAALSRALALLDSADIVLGPCDDGGYYLLGVRGSWPSGVLEAVRWSTPDALDDTRSLLERAGLRCTLLPSAYDIDHVDDLVRLQRDLLAMPAGALPNLRATLGRHC